MVYIIVQLIKGAKGEVVGSNYYKGVDYLPNKAPNGLLWSSDRAEAYEFAMRTNAENFMGGSQLRNCVIHEK